MWTTYQDYFHISTMFDVSIDDLTLSPGIKYRISLKLCAKTICFDPIKTNGVMVMANPPVSGSISINHLNTTETGGAEKVSELLPLILYTIKSLSNGAPVFSYILS